MAAESKATATVTDVRRVAVACEQCGAGQCGDRGDGRDGRAHDGRTYVEVGADGPRCLSANEEDHARCPFVAAMTGGASAPAGTKSKGKTK